jgi:hypothetical protein
LWQILQCNTACREVVRQVQILFCLQGQSIDEGTSAYCQSRSKNLWLCYATGVQQRPGGASVSPPQRSFRHDRLRLLMDPRAPGRYPKEPATLSPAPFATSRCGFPGHENRRVFLCRQRFPACLCHRPSFPE